MGKTKLPVAAETVRRPVVGGIGIRYAPELLNVVLTETKPGYEHAVIGMIDEQLEKYAKGLVRAEWARLENTPVPVDCPVHCDTSSLPPLLSTPIHANTFGRYSLASFFTSFGFGLCQKFGTLTHVNAEHLVVGALPRPIEAFDFDRKHLCCDVEHFFRPAPGSAWPKDLKLKALPADAAEMPVLAISQFQVSGLLSAISAGNLVLPTLLAVEEIISKTCEQIQRAEKRTEPPPIKALLLDSYGWSDFTLLIRCSSISHANQCIHNIRKLRIMDIYALREKLISQHLRDKSSEVHNLKNEQKAINRRFCRIVNSLAGAKQGKTATAENAVNHFFNTSLSVAAVLWPFTHVALEEKRLVHGEKKTSGRKLPIPYENWNLDGKITGEIRIGVRPGHEAEVKQVLDDFKRGIPSKPEKRASTIDYFHVLGFSDIRYPLAILGGEPQAKEDEVIVETKDTIARIYFLRWLLLNKPLKRVYGIPLPWLADRPNPQISINFFTAHLQGEVHDKKDFLNSLHPAPKRKPVNYRLSEGYEEFVARYARRTKISYPLREYDAQLKQKRVNRYLRDALVQDMSLWRRQLFDLAESDRMIELIDSFDSWKCALGQCLKNPDTPKQVIENVIRCFTTSFDEAVVQRVLAGFHMSNSPDFVAEFKGGLAKLLTGLDGLMKGILALVGESTHVGALTLVGQDPMARVEVKTVLDTGPRKLANESIFAVARINSTHLIHPIKISGVLHEMFHVVLKSHGFQTHIASINGGKNLLKLLNSFPEDSPSGLMKRRVEEMFVEYLIAWLVFKDDPALYTKSFLAQLWLHPETFASDSLTNHLVLVEHLARSYMLENMLRREQDFKAKDLRGLKQHVGAWWDQNFAYITCNKEAKRRLGSALEATVDRWCSLGEFSAYAALICKTTKAYFTGGRNIDRNQAYRASFLKSLNRSRHLVVDIQNLLQGEDHFGIPVQVVFHKTGENRDRTLRCRRLESLVGYLLLTRAFYGIVQSWFEDDAARLVRRRAATVDFSRLENGIFDNFSDMLLDRLRGTLFSVGTDAHCKYMGLRVSMIKSLWHLAEITKNSELLHMNGLR